jgi:thioredoxin reductase/ferredoxin
MGPFARYAHWLHLRFPHGSTEKLPLTDAEGRTSLSGLWVTGDLRGIPLLKFAADSGARAVEAISAQLGKNPRGSGDSASEGGLDLVIVGAGVSGMAAALEAKKRGLAFAIVEARHPFATLADYPKQKPIFTYPTDFEPSGDLSVKAGIKEALIEELEAQQRDAGIEVENARVTRVEKTRQGLKVHRQDQAPLLARHVIVAIGRSGDFRTLGVPGEDGPNVTHRLHDPGKFKGRRALVVGGGDSGVETALALANGGAQVTLSCRSKKLTRPKKENLEALHRLVDDGTLRLVLGSGIRSIDAEKVILTTNNDQDEEVLENDVVFVMAGRNAPLDFFRRSGVAIRGEWRLPTYATLVAFLALCTAIYLWKAGGAVTAFFQREGLFPFGMSPFVGATGALSKTLAITLKEPGFYYSLAYSLAIVLFGVDRMRRRKTPYVRLQTLTLMGIQVLPLFLLPYLLLPTLGHLGLFDGGALGAVADGLFPAVGYGHGREYWRAFGLILAWPLFIWNVFTDQPLWAWLFISFLQTFVLIPLLVFRWGKGAYCGWICSCGALAETLGDRHREKMPHGPFAKRLNLAGQIILALVLLIFLARILSWLFPQTDMGQALTTFYRAGLSDFALLGIPLNYQAVVDLLLAGILGVGLYFWFSGRVWCRFFCPLAALMHIYARFSRFSIFSEKEKCISCGACTQVCHQGIDVMHFASQGAPMNDPQCVRCSACVGECPTGTLFFGRQSGKGLPVIEDPWPASPVRMREGQRKTP